MILIVTHFNCFKMLEKWKRIKKNITTISKSITQITNTNILGLFKRTKFVYNVVCSLNFLMTLFYDHFSIIKIPTIWSTLFYSYVCAYLIIPTRL